MKNFVAPEMETEKLVIEDVITTSQVGGGGDSDAGGFEEE